MYISLCDDRLHVFAINTRLSFFFYQNKNILCKCEEKWVNKNKNSHHCNNIHYCIPAFLSLQFPFDFINLPGHQAPSPMNQCYSSLDPARSVSLTCNIVRRKSSVNKRVFSNEKRQLFKKLYPWTIRHFKYVSVGNAKHLVNRCWEGCFQLLHGYMAYKTDRTH